MEVIKEFGKRFVFFDGSMGTMLQKSGLKPGELPDLLNIKAPEKVEAVHRAYIEAGADIITTNTFGCNPHSLNGTGFTAAEVIRAGIDIARRAGAKVIAQDIGPLGQLMQPMGPLSFDEAYDCFKQQVLAGVESGADLFIIETLSDIYEAKAAILAVKENSTLPVICTMSFQADGRTFVGADPLAAVLSLSGLGVDAFGVNCSLGPAELLPIVKQITEYSPLPVIVQANAGLPKISGGETVYDISPEEYTADIVKMADMGVCIFGGCCGTTPDYIAEMKAALSGRKPVPTSPKRITALTSGTKNVILDGRVTVIGERINPTGKKRLKQAIKECDMDYITGEAISQRDRGADVLDVNISLPDIDEPEMMAKTVLALQAIVDLPLQIDSSDPAAIEAGVRICRGKPLINSVNGKHESMEKIFPIAKKYGAAVLGLALDENGIPHTAEERYRIAEKILNTAKKYGIPEQDVLIDCLTLTASAQQQDVMATIDAIKLVKQRLNLKTVLGVSNVSFGLPQREQLNSVFLAAAFGAGLDAPIINPLSDVVMNTVRTFKVINNQDKNAVEYVGAFSGEAAADAEKKVSSSSSGKTLYDIIVDGDRAFAADAARKALESSTPIEIINSSFIPALDIVGKKFEKGEIFLPQLLMSAQTVKNAFDVLKAASNSSEQQNKGTIVIATVYGDIHDIGKNIVKMMLSNYGYNVIDLGKDVPPQTVVDTVLEKNVKLVGLSALMTTTVKSMADTITALRKAGADCKVMVGGAVLNEEYAKLVGADFYAKDALESVKIADKFFGN